jgi:hypothetical protein
MEANTLSVAIASGVADGVGTGVGVGMGVGVGIGVGVGVPERQLGDDGHDDGVGPAPWGTGAPLVVPAPQPAAATRSSNPNARRVDRRRRATDIDVTSLVLYSMRLHTPRKAPGLLPRIAR